MNEPLDLLPLAPLAQGMAFESLQAEHGRPYFQQILMTLDGVEPATFRSALSETLAAYPNLMVAVEYEELETPLAVVMAGVSLPWAEEDWRHLSADAFERRMESHLAADRARGFDLTRPPLMRALFVRESDSRWRLCLSYHHLLMDGWSASLLFEEVAERYRAARECRPPRLAARRPYVDYLSWLAAQDAASAQKWWKAYLLDAPATPLPLAGGRAPRRNAEVRREVSEAGWRALRALCRSLGVTPASAAAAAWALVLARAGGEEDVVFGTTVSGRPQTLAGAEGMIGLFINTVPLRVSTPALSSLRDLLLQVQAGVADVSMHGHLPLSRIQNCGGSGRAQFDSLFVFENYPSAVGAAESALGVVQSANREESNYPGALILEPSAGSLSVSFFYDAGRLTNADAELLVERYLLLLGAMAAADGETPLDRLAHLTPRDRAAACALRAKAAPADPPLLGDRFLAVAAASGGAAALCQGAETMSYAQLRERALAVANALADRGIGPGSIVGIAMPQDMRRYVVLLGIFLRGAASFVIDLDQPAGRIAGAEQAVGPDVVIVGEEEVPGSDRARHIRYDAVAATSGEGEPARPSLDDLAYVILTSGSTGKPKPVGVSYRAIGHFIARRSVDEGAGESLAHALQLQFDASFVELSETLFSGGSLILPSPQQDLQTVMESCGASAVALTPSLLGLLAAERLPSLARITTGGEAISPELANRWSAGRRLLNSYGPTEATVYATQAELKPGDAVTIGRPLPYVSAYVLSPCLRPVGIGELGELYLAGPGLARGYLGLPGLTARAFLPDPFGPPGSRMYRSGDLARIASDGSLIFAGRRDDQVKLRGLRVELGEIEAAIVATAGLSPAEAAATLVPGPDGRARLVACVTRDVDLAFLTAGLARRLPAPLQPQAVLRIDAMPLTRSAKIDRKLLALLAAAAQPFRSAPSADQGTAVEQKIAEALASALGLERLGPEDDFFALGGDSIVSLQAAAAARRAGLPLTPAAILTQRNPRAIAAEMAREGPGAPSSSLVTLDEGPGLPVLLIGGAGGGPEAMLSVARGLAGRTVRAFRPGADRTTIASLAEAVVDAVPRQDLRRGTVLVGHSFGAYVALEAARRLRAGGHDAWLIVLDAAAPLADRPRKSPDGDGTLYAGLAAMAAEVMGREAAAPPDRAAILDLLVEAGIAPDAVAAEALIAEAREHGRENARYVGAPLPLPTMLLVRAAERAEPPRPFEPPLASGSDWGWGRLTAGHVATATAPGNHISMLRGDAGIALGAMLRAYVDFELAVDPDMMEERIHAR